MTIWQAMLTAVAFIAGCAFSCVYIAYALARLEENFWQGMTMLGLFVFVVLTLMFYYGGW